MLAAGFTRLAPAAVKTADTLIDRPISNPVPAVTRWNLLASPPSRRRRGRHFAGSVAPRADPLLVLLSPAARSCDSAGRPVATHPRLSNSSFGLVLVISNDMNGQHRRESLLFIQSSVGDGLSRREPS
jgi:hypothetical protein